MGMGGMGVCGGGGGEVWGRYAAMQTIFCRLKNNNKIETYCRSTVRSVLETSTIMGLFIDHIDCIFAVSHSVQRRYILPTYAYARKITLLQIE